MRNILITGGAGFIGSQFVRTLYKYNTVIKQFNIVVLDKLTYAGSMKNIKGFYDEFYFHGIEDAEVSYILARENIDTVVNLAAETHVDRSIKNPDAFIKTDILGLFNLIKCCRTHWKGMGITGKFVHISTDEVYGPLVKGEFTEDDKLNPTSPYSASKAAGDLLLGAFIKTYNFPAIIIRPCNNFGPRQYPEKLIPMIITKKMVNEKVPVHGIGKEIREWIYVADCCEAIFKLTRHAPIGQIYNVGSGYRCTNLDLILNIQRLMCGGTDSDLEFLPNRPGNDFRYAINSHKTMTEIGPYLGMRPINNKFKRTIKWYLEHPDYFKDADISANIYKEGEYLR